MASHPSAAPIVEQLVHPGDRPPAFLGSAMASIVATYFPSATPVQRAGDVPHPRRCPERRLRARLSVLGAGKRPTNAVLTVSESE
jgi:hypothetical protein